jgi:lipopolysaccharide/colanic/teichoic acid biosynthesis glycosyltransferase
MIVDADRYQHHIPNQVQGHIFKNFNDPRITSIGKLLRRTSLDEFPQFWNVLKGEMSLVGTRPPTPEEVARYAPHHFQRLRVKPGLTGEWQVRGRSKIIDFEEIVQLDLEYQRRWSITHDLRLIWQTIGVVLTGHGAC